MPPPLPRVPDEDAFEENALIEEGTRPLKAGEGSTTQVGEAIDAGKGRIFPCEQCGSDLQFEIGTQRLKCPHCGHEKDLEFDPNAAVAEQDVEAMLARLVEWREQGVADQQQTSEVRCEACGGQVEFTGALTSTACPYCASPIQRENVHTSEVRVPVDGVLPFLVDHQRAAQQLREWVRQRWFAPNEFKRTGADGRFQKIYEPYWTFDFETFSRYDGQRGDHYYVTVGEGKDQRQERRTRWSFANGAFHRFFDDIMCFASTGLPVWIAEVLEPWPLTECQPFNQQMLAGFLARTYDIPLDAGLQEARRRAESALNSEARQRIGGDEQRIDRMDTQYNAMTYKHLLLPLWLLAYRYRGKLYRVAINGATGEVQGERPYSVWKILFAILMGILVVVGIVLIVRSQQ